eukprot:COSAG02_NODE_314_length_24915_cov_18.575596_6_plen_76_part_00
MRRRMHGRRDDARACRALVGSEPMDGPTMVHNVLRPWSERDGAATSSPGDSDAAIDGSTNASILVVDADFVTCTN